MENQIEMLEISELNKEAIFCVEIINLTARIT